MTDVKTVAADAGKVVAAAKRDWAKYLPVVRPVWNWCASKVAAHPSLALAALIALALFAIR